MSYWIGKRVVITDGAGFLGSHVLEKLRERGCEHFFVVRSQDYDLSKEAAVEKLSIFLPVDRFANDIIIVARRTGRISMSTIRVNRDEPAL